MNAMHRGFRWMANVRGVTAMAGLALATLVLTGCSTTRNRRQRSAQLWWHTPIAAGASYRFERLPVARRQAAQEPLEAAAAKGTHRQRPGAQ